MNSGIPTLSMLDRHNDAISPYVHRCGFRLIHYIRPTSLMRPNPLHPLQLDVPGEGMVVVTLSSLMRELISELTSDDDAMTKTR